VVNQVGSHLSRRAAVGREVGGAGRGAGGAAAAPVPSGGTGAGRAGTPWSVKAIAGTGRSPD